MIKLLSHTKIERFASAYSALYTQISKELNIPESIE